jgi:hypothetical protein
MPTVVSEANQLICVPVPPLISLKSFSAHFAAHTTELRRRIGDGQRGNRVDRRIDYRSPRSDVHCTLLVELTGMQVRQARARSSERHPIA